MISENLEVPQDLPPRTVFALNPPPPLIYIKSSLCRLQGWYTLHLALYFNPVD